MRCFRCFRPTRVDQDSPVKLESEEEQGKLVLKSLVNTIAVDSGNYTHRLIADEILQISSGKPRIRVFTYAEVLDATKNFNADNVIGEGGFGKVYKGYLTDIKQDIAVKQLKKNGLQGNREFLVEALMLSLLHHENLVNLIGYCAEEDQRILIYEHMALGSLEEHLLDLSPNQKPLSWETRMKIAEGAARGLEYLHETANPPIIYRDYKASNLLLDANYNPKLSDFGLAKVGPIGSKTHVTTRVMGTYGYCAPEYALTGQLTTMSDVYSFGVVFLEIISGRRVIDTSRPEDEQNLVQWAEPRLRDKKKFTELADPLLKGNYPMKDLYKALAVAAMCLQDDAGARPAISDVVSALQYLVASKDCKESKDSKLFSHDQENEAGNATRNEATSHFHVTSLGKRQTSTREELVQQ